jgi:integrase
MWRVATASLPMPGRYVGREFRRALRAAAEPAGLTSGHGPVKTRAGNRTVTLPAVAALALRDHLRRWTAPDPDALVFLAERGAYLRRSNFHRRVRVPATEQAGVPGLRLHDLRHTAGTLAIVAGAAGPSTAGVAQARKPQNGSRGTQQTGPETRTELRFGWWWA